MLNSPGRIESGNGARLSAVEASRRAPRNFFGFRKPATADSILEREKADREADERRERELQEIAATVRVQNISNRLAQFGTKIKETLDAINAIYKKSKNGNTPPEDRQKIQELKNSFKDTLFEQDFGSLIDRVKKSEGYVYLESVLKERNGVVTIDAATGAIEYVLLTKPGLENRIMIFSVAESDSTAK